MKNKNNLILGVIVALVIGGAVGFFGGMTYQKSQRPTFAGFNGERQMGQGQFGQRPGGNSANNRGVIGEILSADSKSITVKLADGSSKIVLLTEKTVINKAATAAITDLKTGQTVSAFGTTNSDGSVTAVNVQLNPEMRGFGRLSPMPTK